jgi:hypothetical protein
MKEELSGTGFVIFGDRVNILQIFQADIIVSPTNDTRLVLNWTPSSIKCSTFHWLPQSAPQLLLVTFETLCWNWKHVLSNLGSLIGCYSCFFSCQRRVAISLGCAYLTNPTARAKHPPRSYHGENSEIGNFSIFRIFTSNLVSKVLY